MFVGLTRVQETLKLPQCHIVGISMGACVALEMAVSHPEQILSVFMVSPLPLVEVSLNCLTSSSLVS